jgi:formate hydrogenlyase subunit 3/multisubunit Na+/H+ antiporter MnhD subunit
MAQLGKSLIAIGVLLAALGVLLWAGSGIPGLNRFGRLPGDIYLHRGNFSLYFPLTSAIIISVVLSLLLAWLRR